MNVAPGLCAACRHSRPIGNARESTFWRCQRSDSDPRFARYPALPVLACPGYESSAGPEAHRPAPAER